jgi:phosphoglycolate phosphatase-like HAD superfamily hydrolase
MNLALDLDGTLITCEPRQSAVLQAVLACRGAQADLTQIWELKSNGASTEQALVELGMESTLARGIAEDWRRFVEDPLWLGMDTVHGGVIAVLSEMREAGARLWLITARSRSEWVPQQLARLGISQWLDQVTVVPTHEAVSAKSEVLRKISAAGFFGDTESDWRASMAVETPFFAVATGQRNAAFLTRMGVELVHHDLRAAWDVFLGELGRRPSGRN